MSQQKPLLELEADFVIKLSCEQVWITLWLSFLITLSGLTKTPVKAAGEPAMLTGNTGDLRDEHISCGEFWTEAQLLPFILVDTCHAHHGFSTGVPVLLG